MNFKDFRKYLAVKSRTHYILVLRNRETWEDKFSIILTPLNLMLLLSSIMVLFTITILLLLSFVDIHANNGFWADTFILLVVGGAGLLVYLTTLTVFQLEEIRQLWKMVSQRLGFVNGLFLK